MKTSNLLISMTVLATLAACSKARNGSGGGVAADFTFSGKASTLTPTDFASVLNIHPLTTKTITHVMAVNPSSQNPTRVVAAIGSDGSFSLPVSSGHSWVIVFIDSSKVGANMIVGAYKSSAHDLDALAATAPGSAALGTVNFTGSVATGSTSDADLLSSLGIDAATADTLGASDDMCLRYINPDIDGDGVIDVNEANANFGLDFHTRFNLKVSASGSTASMTDLENNYLVNTAGIDYSGVGAYLGWTKSYYDVANDPTVSTLVTTGTSPYNGLVNGNSTTGWGDYHAAGVEFSSSTEVAQGQYVFNINGAKTFTFTNIKTKTLAQLTAAEEFIMPFIKFNTVGSTTGAAVESIGYEWRIRRSGTWEAATLGELAAIVNSQGAYISFKPALDSTPKNVGFMVPSTSVSGTIPLTVAASTGLEGGMTEAELTSITVKKICHMGLSYDDKLGARYFAGVMNVPAGSGGCN